MHFIESSMAIIVLLTLNFIFLSSLQILTEFISMIFFYSYLLFYLLFQCNQRQVGVDLDFSDMVL